MRGSYGIGVLCLCFLGNLLVVFGAEHRSTTTNITKPWPSISKLEIPEHELMLFHGSKFKRWSLKHGRQEELHHPKPCACDVGVCACCSGLLLGLFGQKACLKIKYSPSDFAFDVTMTFNDQVMYENSISGNNPAPVCISPPRIPDLNVCTKFSNVFFPGRNFHFCASMLGRWRAVQLFDISFDCLRMGAQGIAMVKPEEGGGLPLPSVGGGGVDAVVDSGTDDIEDYDENLVRSLFDIFERRRR